MPENSEIVRSLWEPFGGVNVAEVAWDADVVRQVLTTYYSPDCELTPLESGIGSGISTHFSGWEGLQTYLQEWMEPFSEYYVENLDYVAVGDCVLVPSRQRAVGAGSGAETEITLTTLFELREGKIVRMQQYDTLAEAREAAANV
jgi:ketosteroid isomerase-like protein